MASNQNESILDFFDTGFGDHETIIHNRQNLSLHSTFRLDHVNNRGSINSQLALSHPITATINFHHQNSLILRSAHPNTRAFRPPNFSQRMIQVRQTAPTLLLQDAIRSSDQVRRPTQFLSSTSTRNRLLLGPNRLIHSNTTTSTGRHVQGLSHGAITLPAATRQQTPTIINLDDHTDHDHNNEMGIVLAPTPLSVVYPSQLNGRQNVDNRDPNSRRRRKPNPSLDQPPRNSNRQNPNVSEERSDQNRAEAADDDNQAPPPPADNNPSNGDPQYDGITHCVRCDDGSYKCPICEGIFDTSQKFASHMRSHYRGENTVDKKRRLNAKFEKKKNRNNLHLVYSDEGLTIAPVNN